MTHADLSSTPPTDVVFGHPRGFVVQRGGGARILPEAIS